MMPSDPLLFTVTDLTQFSYCGRVVYYEQCLPHIRPRTFKMDRGRDEHEAEQKRATRRTLSKYAVDGGQREFDLKLTDATLHLTGILDEVVSTADGDLFPVDYKLADKVSLNHKVQLTAYGLLLEANRGQPIHHGFVYLIKPRRMVEVTITPALRNEVQTLLQNMTHAVTHEQMPPPASNHGRCVACEFRRFCNDV